MVLKVNPRQLFAFQLVVLAIVGPQNARLGSVENPVTVGPAVMLAVILVAVLLLAGVLGMSFIVMDLSETGPTYQKKLPPITKRRWWGGVFNFSAGFFWVAFLLDLLYKIPGGDILATSLVILLGIFMIVGEARGK